MIACLQFAVKKVAVVAEEEEEAVAHKKRVFISGEYKTAVCNLGQHPPITIIAPHSKYTALKYALRTQLKYPNQRSRAKVGPLSSFVKIQVF